MMQTFTPLPGSVSNVCGCNFKDRKLAAFVLSLVLLRIIFNSKTDTYDALLSRAKLPSLHNRRLQNIAILIKVKNGLVPDYIMELFRNSNKGYSLTSICLVSLQFIMEKTPLDILVLTFGQNWAQLTKIDWPSVTLERILETKTSVL